MNKALILLAVHWKQSWRSSSPSSGSKFLAFFTLLIVLVPASLLLAWSVSSLVFPTDQPGRSASRILALGFCAYYAYSLLSPFFGKELSDSHEIEKARIFPVPASILYSVAVVFTAFSPGFLFLFPTLLLLLFPVSSHPVTFLLNLLILILFMIHTAQVRLGISLLAANLLRKRRYQDLLRLLLPLTGIIFFTLMQFSLYSHPSGFAGLLLAVSLPEWTAWTPFFWHSGLISFQDHSPVQVVYQVLMVLISVPLLGMVGIPLLNRALVSEMESSSTGKLMAKDWDTASLTTHSKSRIELLPKPLWAVFHKEIRMMRREPAIKTLLIQQSFLFLLPFVGVIAQTGFDLEKILVRGMDFLLPSVLILLYVEFQVCFLSLGFEGRAIQHMFMAPIKMGSLLLGKNLALGLVAGVWNSLLISALCTFFGNPGVGPVYLILGISLLLVVVGWGCLSSVILPIPVSTTGKSSLTQTGSERRGCLFALWNYINTGILVLFSLPPLLVCHFKGLLDREATGVNLLPLGVCLLYGLLVFLVLTWLATKLLENRQYRIFELFVQAGR